MALNTLALQAGAAAIAAGIDRLRLHTGDPTSSAGAQYLTAAPDQSVVCSASNGIISAPAVVFTGGAAYAKVAYVSLWSGSLYWGSYALGSDDYFDGTGEYSISALVLTGTSD